MKIRKAEVKDLKVIQGLNEKLFIHDSDFDSSIDINWPLSKDGEDFYNKYITEKNCIALVMENDQKNIAAYIVADIRDGYFTKKDKNKIIVIEDTYIEEEYRGQGFGKQMFSEVENFAKENGVHKMELSVNARNKNALGFYSSLGFESYSIEMEKDL